VGESGLDGPKAGAWVEYLQTDNPFALLPINAVPYLWLLETNRWSKFLYPSIWLSAGVLALIFGTYLVDRKAGYSSLRLHRGWIALSICLLMGWVLAPWSLGPGNGSFVPMRFLPLALIAVVPVFVVGTKRIWALAAAGALALAVTTQSAAEWYLALTSNHFASAFIEATPYVGTAPPPSGHCVWHELMPGHLQDKSETI